ncbi:MULTISPECIES: hypothetical protein [Fusobacterium]|uniref:hypothetical protein n=1 Tax=Fusobacterium TaxID=848 RepID=UPI0014771CEE|nr:MULTISPECIES: hypothetical protein [Fusobacterium]NME36542.1 hypothetical protein [Fusobacterium sp. FSA-380-WT-3A]
MFYSAFIVLNNDEVKSWININSKEEFMEKVCSPFLSNDKFQFNGEIIDKSQIKEVRFVETEMEQIGDYKLILRYIKETKCYGDKFVSEKYPIYYVKDITKEIIK